MLIRSNSIGDARMSLRGPLGLNIGAVNDCSRTFPTFGVVIHSQQFHVNIGSIGSSVLSKLSNGR
jgi:hypothetical protein